MNLKDFKLLKEDGDNFHLAHPSGRSFVVEKRKLSQKAHGAIQKLSDGGEVAPKDPTAGTEQPNASNAKSGEPVVVNVNTAPPSQPQSPPPAPAAPVPFVQNAAHGVGNVLRQGVQDVAGAYGRIGSAVGNAVAPAAMGLVQGIAGAPAEAAVAPGAPEREPAASSQPQAAPEGSSESSPAAPINQKLDAGTQALMAEKQANSAKATAEANVGNAEANAIAENQKKIGEMETQQQILQRFQKGDQELRKAYESKKIDPDRYLNNMKTGSRIAAGIGMILSGFGGGAARQSNLALDMLNKSIDNDIEAQRNDQSKSMNLWKMNREALGNDLAANLATQNQMYTGLKYKLDQAAAGARGPLAKANAQAANAVVDQKIAENHLKLSVLSMGQGGQPGATNQGGGKLSPMDPAILVTQLVSDPAARTQVFKEIESAEHVATNKKKMVELFKDAATQNTVVKRLGGALGDPASLKTLKAMMVSQVPNVDKTVRQAAVDSVEHNLLPQRGDSDSTVQTKLEGLVKWMDANAQGTTARGYGINLDRFARTSKDPRAILSPKETKFYEWAKANPSDPRAVVVMKKLGVH